MQQNAMTYLIEKNKVQSKVAIRFLGLDLSLTWTPKKMTTTNLSPGPRPAQTLWLLRTLH